MAAVRKKKLAVWKFASCDGCQLTLLDCEDELLALIDRLNKDTQVHGILCQVPLPEHIDTRWVLLAMAVIWSVAQFPMVGPVAPDEVLMSVDDWVGVVDRAVLAQDDVRSGARQDLRIRRRHRHAVCGADIRAMPSRLRRGASGPVLRSCSDSTSRRKLCVATSVSPQRISWRTGGMIAAVEK